MKKVNLNYDFIKKIKANRCALVLVGAGLGLTTSGCVITIDVPDDFMSNFDVSVDENGNYNIKYDNEDETYAVITDETKVSTTDSSVTDVVETTTVVPSTTFVETSTATMSTTQSSTVTTNSPVQTTTTTTTTTTEIENPTLPVSTEAVAKSFYSCRYGYGEYKVQNGDTLSRISDMTGMSVEDLMSLNGMYNDSLVVGDYIAAPALIVSYNIDTDASVEDISFQTGVSKDEICRLNTASENFVFSAGYSVTVSTLFGGEISYETSKGKANVINNTVIFGEKLIRNGNNVLALQENKYELWCNDVILYTFDSNNNYETKHLFSNVKDIDLVKNVPVAYIRTSNDVKKLISNAQAYCYFYDEDYFSTVNNVNYPIYMDDNLDILYTYDGMQHDFNEFNYDAGYFQYRKDFCN